ncbi:hypothetical protein Zmor_025709 [Zophobas morio]|uniref:Microsomal glutathione S-transferase 1 n=1 Tax=Zophobas morio TaxID=2755281 RepID=A0AA38HSQ3_9CUCU|nr:hypothetical protein Zmor_025709 [Zophobas morio]
MTNSTTMAHAPREVLSLKNPSFCAYMVCSCILVIKMIAVALLTAYKRKVHKVYLSPEDVKTNTGQIDTHDDVERVRRAHLNDLENIPLFWTTAFVFLFAKPPVWLACLMFFTFVIARIGHTIVYAVYVVRQPARAVCFLTGLVITLYMALHAMIVGFAHI